MFAEREDLRTVDYQPVAALVNLISVDTWDVPGQIRERRPAIMLSELIDYRTRSSSQRPERSELRPHLRQIGPVPQSKVPKNGRNPRRIHTSA
jgi:hypothetical protein